MQNQAEQRNPDPEDDLIADIESYADNPEGFVRYAYPWGEGELKDELGPDEWQIEILTSIRDQLRAGKKIIQIAVASGHDIGKTALIAWLICWGMSTEEDTRIIVTANTETQLTTKTWPELAKWHRLSINKHWFRFEATSFSSIDPLHKKNWRADAIPWSEHKSEAFAGLHNEGKRVFMFFDEGSAIADSIYEVAETSMLDSKAMCIWCVFGNPTRNTGRFKDCFGRYKHRWTQHQIDSRSCKRPNKEKIQQWIDDYGLDSDFVKVRVRGMFPSMSAKQFFSVADVDNAFGRDLRPDQYQFAPKIITVDPAWEGNDMMEIGWRQGLAYKHLRTIPKNDNDLQMANLIAQIEDDEKADAVFIDAGFGTGIGSAGRTWGRKWLLVWFSEASADPGCLNKRAEMANNAKKWLKDGGAIPDDKELYEDLLAPEIVPRSDGKIQLEDKKLIKKRLGRSPGKFDAFILSFAYPVHKLSGQRVLGNEQGKHVSDYDPYRDD